MPLNSSRVAGLVAAALALALTISGGVILHAFAAAPKPSAKKTPPPSPPLKVKAEKSQHDHMAMEKEKPAKGTQAEGKYMTIVGEVMDPACFLEAGTKSIGPGHYQCAYDCARSGQTLAIYARDEDGIDFIAGELRGKNPNVPLLPYVHKKVDVTGTVYHRSDAWGIVIVKVALHDDKAPSGAKSETSGLKSEPIGAKSSGVTGAPAGK